MTGVESEVTLERLTHDPHRIHAGLRSRGPIAWVTPLDGWLVLDRAPAVEIMRDDETFTVDHPGFTTAQVVGPSMLSLDGPEHRRHREPFAGAFRVAEIRRRFSHRLDGRASAMVAALQPRGWGELRTELAAPFAVDVVAELLGMLDVDALELLALYRDIVDAVTVLSAGGEMPETGPQAVEVLRGLVKQAGAAGENLLAEVARSLTSDEVVSNAAVMLFGGIETSEGMMATALWYLLDVPGLAPVIRTDRTLVAPLIEESLRMEPAASRVDRYATIDVSIGGVHVQKDDLVIVSLSAANRDPAVYGEPDVFQLGRDHEPLNVSFAQGPHICIGQHLARLETAAIVNAVLDGLADVRLDEDAARGHEGLVFRKPQAVAARWDPAAGRIN